MEKKIAAGKVLKLVKGDITKVPADAIANAANSGLRGGGGVDGAIHRAGGSTIMDELDEIRAASGGCPTGSAVATTAGNLPARYVFHAVGPVYHGGGRSEADLLASCYATCMKLAAEKDARSISFPSISTGIYGYPIEHAAPIAIRTVFGALRDEKNPVETATFVLFDQATYDAYARTLAAFDEQKLE